MYICMFIVVVPYYELFLYSDNVFSLEVYVLSCITFDSVCMVWIFILLFCNPSVSYS